MKKIGLLSDTHGYLDPEILDIFSDRDEIWHAGDFGDPKIAVKLKDVCPLVGVYGNIDGQKIRSEFPLHQKLEREGLKVWMTHIGGIPGRYCIPIKDEIESNPPDLFICGHSHILKVARDKDRDNMLYINPGAAGRHGVQIYRTIVRFELNDRSVDQFEVINLGERSG